eukprot:Lithocolla_globosa_v1_NODE_5134_length_1298_cov_107.108608.p1 type:complete len:411 gc:universal NODE_5134_length_1298_cov_107.108608:1238-6(-)
MTYQKQVITLLHYKMLLLLLFLVLVKGQSENCELMYQQWEKDLQHDCFTNQTEAYTCQHHCIQMLVKFVSQVEQNQNCLNEQGEEMKEEQEEGQLTYSYFQEEQQLIEKKLEMCNKCVVANEDYLLLFKRFQENGCLPTPSLHSCAEYCVETSDTLLNMWDVMISEKICRKNNPGGCSEDGGITEGEIYNNLTTAESYHSLATIATLGAVCDDNCSESLRLWYISWSQVMNDFQDACAFSDNMVPIEQFEQSDPAFMSFGTVTSECSQKCKDAISGLRQNFTKLDSSCHVGLPSSHQTSITESLHHCPSDEIPELETTHLTFVATIVLSIVILVVVYLLLGICYKRSVGYSGLEQIPHIKYCRHHCCRKKQKGDDDADEVHLNRIKAVREGQNDAFALEDDEDDDDANLI